MGSWKKRTKEKCYSFGSVRKKEVPKALLSDRNRTLNWFRTKHFSTKGPFSISINRPVKLLSSRSFVKYDYYKYFLPGRSAPLCTVIHRRRKTYAMADQPERARRNLKPWRTENFLHLSDFSTLPKTSIRVLRSKKWTVKRSLFRKETKELWFWSTILSQYTAKYTPFHRY